MKSVGYVLILGRPLIFYLGILTITTLLITALIGFLNYNGEHRIPFKWHIVFASATVIIALTHGFLAVIAYL